MDDNSFWEEILEEVKLIFSPVESADTGQVLLPTFIDEAIQMVCFVWPLLCLARHFLTARDWKTKLWAQLKEINDKIDADSARTQELVELLRNQGGNAGSDGGDTDIWGNYQGKPSPSSKTGGSFSKLPAFRDARLDQLLRRAVDEGLTTAELVEEMHAGVDSGKRSEAVLLKMWEPCLRHAERAQEQAEAAADVENQTQVNADGTKKHRRGSITRSAR